MDKSGPTPGAPAPGRTAPGFSVPRPPNQQARKKGPDLIGPSPLSLGGTGSFDEAKLTGASPRRSHHLMKSISW
jgi:hypothetical protein